MTRSGFRIAALLLLGVLLATNIYRAATQSIVHDEALTWQYYLSGPSSAIFHTFTANNPLAAVFVVLLPSKSIAKTRSIADLATLLASLASVGSALLLIVAHLADELCRCHRVRFLRRRIRRSMEREELFRVAL